MNEKLLIYQHYSDFPCAGLSQLLLHAQTDYFARTFLLEKTLKGDFDEKEFLKVEEQVVILLLLPLFLHLFPLLLLREYPGDLLLSVTVSDSSV